MLRDGDLRFHECGGVHSLEGDLAVIDQDVAHPQARHRMASVTYLDQVRARDTVSPRHDLNFWGMPRSED